MILLNKQINNFFQGFLKFLFGIFCRNSKMPMPDSEGRIEMLNKTGWSLKNLDEYSLKFISYAKDASAPVLEVGAGYGFATIEALAQGAIVIANDIDKRHLNILKNNTPKEFHDRLILKRGSFISLKGIPNNSLSAILCARVLHFFDGKTLELVIKKMYNLLIPGGKVFIVTSSPYTKNWQTFIPIYEKRKRAGWSYPGIVDDISTYNPEYVGHVPDLLNFMDPEVLSNAFRKENFFIEQTGFMNRQDYASFIRLDPSFLAPSEISLN